MHGLYIFMRGFDTMEPRLANIRSARLSACLLVTLLFLDSQETSAQRCIPLGWPGYR